MKRKFHKTASGDEGDETHGTDDWMSRRFLELPCENELIQDLERNKRVIRGELKGSCVFAG